MQQYFIAGMYLVPPETFLYFLNPKIINSKENALILNYFQIVQFQKSNIDLLERLIYRESFKNAIEVNAISKTLV